MTTKRKSIEAGITYLTDRGIECVELSEYHFRVAGAFDFWPSTGRWKMVRGGHAGHGKDKLADAVLALHGKEAPRLNEAPPVTLPTLARPAQVIITKKRSRKNRR